MSIIEKTAKEQTQALLNKEISAKELLDETLDCGQRLCRFVVAVIGIGDIDLRLLRENAERVA